MMCSTSLERKCRTLFIWTNVDKREEVSEAIWPLKVRSSQVWRQGLWWKLQVLGLDKRPPLSSLGLDHARKGTVMLLGNSEISCLTPNRTNLFFFFFFRIDPRWWVQHHSETSLRSSATWRRDESMSFDANEKYILVLSVFYEHFYSSAVFYV